MNKNFPASDHRTPSTPPPAIEEYPTIVIPAGNDFLRQNPEFIPSTSDENYPSPSD